MARFTSSTQHSAMARVTLALLLSGPWLIAAVPGQESGSGIYPQDRIGLTLDFSSIEGFKAEMIEHRQIQCRLVGELGKSKVALELWTFPREQFRYQEPSGIAAFIETSRRRKDPRFRFDQKSVISGSFGYVPYAIEATGPDRTSGKRTGDRHYLFGILPDHCYQIVATATPALDAAAEQALKALLRACVKYNGKVRDSRWTDAEATRRWREHSPEKVHKQLKIKRTKHYIILYNAGGALFAKKMEEFYKAIQKVFPFPEIESRALMPVFLFRINQQYFTYYAAVANTSRSSAERSKGHAWRDYYATYYDSPNDPVHIHEATHQIFSNRLHLSGGGSWFQEGVADYMSEKKNTIRASVRNQIRNGEYLPFKNLMIVPSLLQSIRGDSVRGGSRATAAYLQSASIIYFLRHSKFGKARFLDFIHRIGALRRGDLKGIEAVLQSIYQVDIAGLETAWKKYWR